MSAVLSNSAYNVTSSWASSKSTSSSGKRKGEMTEVIHLEMEEKTKDQQGDHGDQGLKIGGGQQGYWTSQGEGHIGGQEAGAQAL